jgi:hypothetical protein
LKIAIVESAKGMSCHCFFKRKYTEKNDEFPITIGVIRFALSKSD